MEGGNGKDLRHDAVHITSRVSSMKCGDRVRFPVGILGNIFFAATLSSALEPSSSNSRGFDKLFPRVKVARSAELT
jgi:hypothetical protein